MGQKKRYNIFSVELIKRDDKLVHVKPATRVLYNEFIKALANGQRATLLLEAHENSGKTAQLAKIHACIREIAISSGCSFRKARQMVKEQSGLFVETDTNDVYEKSFGACSSSELNLAVIAIIEIGDIVGINFRTQFPKYEQEKPKSALKPDPNQEFPS